MGDIRRRGRRFDPAKIRLILREKYGDESISAFADLIEEKSLKSRTGDQDGKLPSRGAVFAFCRGDRTDKRTWESLCRELGVDSGLLEKPDVHDGSKPATGKKKFKSRWSWCHPASYFGEVWIQLTRNPESRGKTHRYFIRWGPWAYTGVLDFGRRASVSLLHMKSNDGLSVPIFLNVSPACCVVFGQGDAPAGAVEDINHGWERVEDG